jgi:hypothetical protein
MYLCASRREGGSCIFVLQYINTWSLPLSLKHINT